MVVVVFLTDLKVLETLAFALMQIMTAFLTKWSVSMVGGWTVERRATFYALHFVVLRGVWHVVLIFGMLFVIFFAIDFRFLIVDVFTSALVVIVFRFLIADVLTFAVEHLEHLGAHFEAWDEALSASPDSPEGEM